MRTCLTSHQVVLALMVYEYEGAVPGSRQGVESTTGTYS
jgi:hypothetical protein